MAWQPQQQQKDLVKHGFEENDKSNGQIAKHDAIQCCLIMNSSQK